MKTAIVNIGTIVSGDWSHPFVAGDSIVMDGGRIAAVGTASAAEIEGCDVVIDADGATVIPGLIDSQVHNTFGDYTPRQKTVGFLESYVHGAVTTAISASEVHVPGRPHDPEGVKALALAAQRCFAHFRPGGMRVWAGSIILEPGLTDADFTEIAAKGVWLAKAGFGQVETPFDYVPMVRAAKEAGMVTTVHTGGASIPDSAPITGDHLLAMQPDVSFHINGGPTAMPDRDFARVILESEIALQVCTAGNLRTTLLCANLARQHDAFARLLIATDTPTGSGVMPLGMIYTMSHLASLTDMPAEWAVCAATGNNARVYRLNSGIIAPGKDADVAIIDAPVGGTQDTALAALKHGDPCAVGAVITDGEPRFVGQSRNTPAPKKRVRVAACRLVRDFATPRH
jgi:enamidase